MTLPEPGDYGALLSDLKAQVYAARTRAALSVNRELVLLYWRIGQAILDRQDQAGWGAKVIDRLAVDLRGEFPDMKGFSSTNLKYMRSFAAAYPDFSIGQQPVDQLPWGHIVTVLNKVKDPAQREWYARAAIQHGWSRNILVHQIETRLIERQGQAATNFERTLPAPQSELAIQLLKDPYTFDFLTLADDAHERDLERGLLLHLRDFMLELGVGFAFVGSQVHLEVGGEDFYIDLLFYHLHLRCYVVIDLKMKNFRPEYAGKMNFYLSAVDDLRRHPQDAPSIGIILCRGQQNGQNTAVVEYALRDMNKPLGVSSFELAEALPRELEGRLPSVEQLEAELERLGEMGEARS